MLRLLFLLASATAIQASALPLLTLNTTSLPQNLTTSTLDLPSFRSYCVDDSLFGGWDGAISNDDCFSAQEVLELHVRHILTKSYTFWSKQNTATPPADGWELPLYAEFKTCVLLLQITKDFGNDVVPFYQGGYLPTGRLDTVVKSSWEMVLAAITAVRAQCLKARGQPGWADIAGGAGGKAAIVLTVPAKSEMARDWARDLGRGEGVWVNGTAVA